MNRSGAARREVRVRVTKPQREDGSGSLRDVTAEPDRHRQSLGWLPWATFVLSIVGLADSGYQVYTHFTGTGLLGCSARSDACVLVQNSQYAWIVGIPVAVLGAAFYAFMVVICAPPAWRSHWPAVGWARLVAVVTGMLFVLYLVYREIISLGEICPYCTSVHIITFILFALVVFAAPGGVGTRVGESLSG